MAIDAERVLAHLAHLYEHWKASEETWNHCDVVCIALGESSEDMERVSPVTCSFHLWMFQYQLPSTLMVVTKEECILITSSAKAKHLEEVISLSVSHDMKFTVLVRQKDQESQKILVERVEEVFRSNVDEHDNSCRLGVIRGEFDPAISSVPLYQTIGNIGSNSFVSKKDVSDAFRELTSICLMSEDVDALKKSAQLSAWMQRKVLTAKIEKIIEDGEEVSHAAIAEFVDEAYRSLDEKVLTKLKLDADRASSAFAPSIQSSNSGFSITLVVPSSPVTNLAYKGSFVCSLGSFYSEAFSAVCRTLLISPSDDQRIAYENVLLLENEVFAMLKDRIRASDFYRRLKQRAREISSNLGDAFPSSVGYLVCCERSVAPDLEINADASFFISPGSPVVLCLLFELQTSTSSSSSSKPSSFVVGFGDTYFSSRKTHSQDSMSEGVICLTAASKKTFTDIEYDLEEEEDEEDEEEDERKNEEHPESLDLTGAQDEIKMRREALTELSRTAESNSSIQEDGSSRRKMNLRNRDASQDVKRKEKLETILQHKEKEWQDLKRRGLITQSGRSSTHVASTSEKLFEGKISSYINFLKFPRGLKFGRVEVDPSSKSLLIPFRGVHVPFHIATVKSASIADEGRVFALRINFNTPAVQAKNFFPGAAAPDQIFLKELSFRSADRTHFEEIVRSVQEMLRVMKQQEKEAAEMADVVQQDALVVDRQNPLALKDVSIIPTLIGEKRANKRGKNLGVFEAHKNGFRFVNQVGDSVDILYNNVAYCFYSPAQAKDKILARTQKILLHFHLKDPIMVGLNKKKTRDVQIYSDVMGEDIIGLDRRMSDAAAIEQERMELQARKRVLNTFKAFADRAEPKMRARVPDLAFDFPFEELEFSGSANRSMITFSPTASCLVSLQEPPFFVLPLDDVEIASLERVQGGQKTFDCVFVLRDYTKEPARIDSIPLTKIDDLRNFLVEVGIVYYEGINVLNWRDILSTIRGDPEWEPWSSEAGWSSFLDVDAPAGSDGSDSDADSEYTEDDDEEFEDGDEDEDFDSDEFVDEDEDDDFEGSDSDDSGLDWEELDRRAVEDDLRMARKRGGEEDDVDDRRPQKKRQKQSSSSSVSKSSSSQGGSRHRR